MRYVFLVLGFLIVIAICDMIGGPHQRTLTAAGGGIVYVIFMSMKKH